MADLNDEQVELLAAQLITIRNPAARRRLIEKGLAFSEIFRFRKEILIKLGFKKNEISLIRSNRRDLAEAEAFRCSRLGGKLIFKNSPEYPELLKEIFDPPDFLYIKGNPAVLNKKNLAVVGSRKASGYGKTSLQKILPPLVKNDLCIVSGMAYGIDSAAHKIAIENNGCTIGVNAGGLEHIHPRGNRKLIDSIIENGCLVCEAPVSSVPRPFMFPVRNRIISGLSHAVFVVEGTARSGSMITARLALDQNRDLFALPGKIDSSLSRAPNVLIQEGAKLITSAADIAIEMGLNLIDSPLPIPAQAAPLEKKVLDLLGANEVKGIDYFVEALDIPVSKIIALLMGLVLKGYIREVSGGYTKII